MIITTDPLFWVLALVGVILTGISKSGFAGGAGVLAVPLMSYEIGVLEATAITLPLLLLMDAQTLRYYWKSIDWAELKGLLPGALLGIIAGGLLMGMLSDALLLLGLGTLSVLFALWANLQQWFAKLKGARYFWSSCSGLTSTLVHAGGPHLNMYLIARKLPKLNWLATAGAFFAAMNLTKLAPYTLNGQWSTHAFMTSLFLIPAAYAGVWLGKRIQGRISEQDFVSICRVLLFMVGIGLIAKAL